MVRIEGNAIWRGDEKAGWVEGHHVYAHDGRRLGYFEGNDIYNEEGHKLAHVEGNHLVSYGGNNEAKISLDAVSERIEGGVLPELAKCAIYILLGD